MWDEKKYLRALVLFFEYVGFVVHIISSSSSSICAGLLRDVVFFKGGEVTAFRLWNPEEGDNQTEEHDTGKDTQSLGQESVLARRTSIVDKDVESKGSQDGTSLARSSRDTVGGSTNFGWEDFTGNDEGSAVGTKVLEELSQSEDDNECRHSFVAKRVVSASQDSKEDSASGEAHDLDRTTTPAFDEEDSKVVTRNRTQASDDDLTNSVVPESLERGILVREADSFQDVRVVETETIECNVEKEPRKSGTEEDLQVLPLPKVGAEFSPVVTLVLDLGILLGKLVRDFLTLGSSGSFNVAFDIQ